MKFLRHLPPGIPRHFLGVGEGRVFPAPTLSQTILGSCVAVTFHCQRLEIGGIIHAMMPAMRDYQPHPDEDARFRYVDTGIQGLFEILLDHGVRAGEIECKVFGGAASLTLSQMSVAARNVKIAFETLVGLGLRIAASHVGGRQGRKLFFCSSTGDVFVKSLNTMQGESDGQSGQRPALR